jgi:hypothetical protein
MLPPLEYDHPYDGELKFITDLDQDTIKRMCGPKTSVACILGGGKLSYAYAAKECWIALARQEEIDRLGLNREMVIRHEIGHCNGWPLDHPTPRWE